VVGARADNLAHFMCRLARHFWDPQPLRVLRASPGRYWRCCFLLVIKSYGVNQGKMNSMLSTFRGIYMLACNHYQIIAHKAVITHLYHNIVQRTASYVYWIVHLCNYSVELPHWSYCSWFDVCWSFGVVGLEWYPCCRPKPVTQIPLQPKHTETPTHIEPRTIRPM